MPHRDQLSPNQPLGLNDYVMAGLSVAFPLLSLGIQLFNWWPQQGAPAAQTAQIVGDILFRKQVAFVATAGIALWIQVRVIQYERSRHGSQWRKNIVSDLLNRTLETIDPDHALNARLNVMTVHPRYRLPFWDSRVPLPPWKRLLPMPRLYVFACSHNLQHTPEARLPWIKNNGCAGDLWASEDHFALANLSDPNEIGRFQLSDCQKRLTKDLSCIATLAIFEGTGPTTRLLGFINLDSNNPAAPESWLMSEDNLGKIRQTLQGLANYLIREDLLR